MTDQNPYTTPDASLAVDTAETYQPRVFSFSGRIGRLRYLAYLTGVYLVVAAVIIPIMIFAGLGARASGLQDISIATGAFIIIGYIAILVLVFTFGKRRMNDLNRSGWWMFLFLVPLANFLLMLYMLLGSGTDGTNDYGAAPDKNSLGVKILGLVFPIIILVGIVAAVALPAYQDYVGRMQ